MDFGAFFLFIAAAVYAVYVTIRLIACGERELRARLATRLAAVVLFLGFWGVWIYKAYYLNEGLVGACINSNVQEARSLLQKGADPNARWEDGTPSLAFAAEASAGRVSLIQLLLANGASVNSKDTRGRTPLWHAKQQGYEDAVKILSAAGGRD